MQVPHTIDNIHTLFRALRAQRQDAVQDDTVTLEDLLKFKAHLDEQRYVADLIGQQGVAQIRVFGDTANQRSIEKLTLGGSQNYIFRFVLRP
mmetsp:Transcript_35663/g.71009  ORF Transcript_35663/g.71009 Transcript_35663/m.71009 type:complete len:92 (+) Transcript_35663:89-364(+)